MKHSLLALALCASLIACGGNKTDQTASTTSATTTSPAPAAPAPTANASALTPEQLGQLGALINKQPANADKLLADQGLTQATFEAAIRKVSSDPAESKRYAAAYKSAS
ncbi:MAG TPA: hypothetical protein VHY33_02570 [Thermoanaerobaculia bacterium]|jgi:hypothetical protein|nr:hypothetical protein [Thermoanaerobaculia bacterium]